jgi:hypothetical protein
MRIVRIEVTCSLKIEFIWATPAEAAKTSELQCKQMTDEPVGKAAYSLCDYSCPRRLATPYVRCRYAILRPRLRKPSRRHGHVVIEMDLQSSETPWPHRHDSQPTANRGNIYGHACKSSSPALKRDDWYGAECYSSFTDDYSVGLSTYTSQRYTRPTILQFLSMLTYLPRQLRKIHYTAPAENLSSITRLNGRDFT